MLNKLMTAITNELFLKRCGGGFHDLVNFSATALTFAIWRSS